MKNKTLEHKTDTQTSLSPYQTERAEAQETSVFRPGPLEGTLARPGREATVQSHADGLNRAQAGRTLRLLQRQYGNRYVQRVVELAPRTSAGLTQRRGGGEAFTLDDKTAGRINRARGGSQQLDGAVQAQMSAALGHDFSGVRVHTDSEADELNQQLSARAFTTGQDIFFRSGAYDPRTGHGQELIGHELTHVVQQSTGKVRGKGSNGMTVRPVGDVFEQEAEALGGRAARATSKSTLQRAVANPATTGPAEILTLQKRYGNAAVNSHPGQGVHSSYAEARNKRVIKKRHSKNRDEVNPRSSDMMTGKPKDAPLQNKRGVQTVVMRNNGSKVSEEWTGQVAEEVRQAIAHLPDKAVQENEKLSGIMRQRGIAPSMYDQGDISIVYPWGTGWIFGKIKVGRGTMGRWLVNKIRIESIGLPTDRPDSLIDKAKNLFRRKKDVIAERQAKYGMTRAELSVLPEDAPAEKMVSWIIRHEVGHAYDAKVRWSELEASAIMFGDWGSPKGEDVLNSFLQDEKAPLVMQGKCACWRTLGMLGYRVTGDGGTPDIQSIDKLCAAHQQHASSNSREVIARAFNRYKAALQAPWLRDDGGGRTVEVDGRMYHWSDQYDVWQSYMAKARSHKVSNYQFESKEEWFAEAFAAYYGSEGSRAKLSDEVKVWFSRELGPSVGAKSSGGGTT